VDNDYLKERSCWAAIEAVESWLRGQKPHDSTLYTNKMRCSDEALADAFIACLEPGKWLCWSQNIVTVALADTAVGVPKFSHGMHCLQLLQPMCRSCLMQPVH
jgi:hypothetical protein